MSSGREIEREFQVDGEVPLDLDDHPCEPISQGYVSIDPEVRQEVRLREKGDQHTLGVKSAPSGTRVEEEIELHQRCFEWLWRAGRGRGSTSSVS